MHFDDAALEPTLATVASICTPHNPPLPANRSPAPSEADPHFDAGPGYTLRRVAGRGAFGCVWAAACRATGRGVAVKRVRVSAGDLVAAARVLREARLLRLMAGHENVIRLLDVVVRHSDKQVHVRQHRNVADAGER